MTTTKRLLYFTMFCALYFSGCVVIQQVYGLDATYISAVADRWIEALMAIAAFYLWKEKNANRNKYAMRWVRQITDDFSPEVAARFAEIVLKD